MALILIARESVPSLSAGGGGPVLTVLVPPLQRGASCGAYNSCRMCV
jgi:hypothetical protein